MTDPDWRPPTSDTCFPLSTRSLGLKAVRSIDPEQARLCFRLIVAALMGLPDPADVSFHYEADSSTCIRFYIRLACMPDTAADHTGTTASTIVRAIAPWLEVEQMEDSVAPPPPA